MKDINSKIIFASMATMACLTIVTTLVMFLRRVKAMKQRVVRVSAFKTLTKENEMPELLVQSSRNFKNLFEIPVLFYVACLLSLTQNLQDGVVATICVLFCLFRIIHTAIHINYNNVFHRFWAFAASFWCIIAFWIYISAKYLLN